MLEMYAFSVFLEPNIHGYFVYMFVYTCILDIWVRVYMYILNLFFNFSYLVTIYPVDALHFTWSGIHTFWGINCRENM